MAQPYSAPAAGRFPRQTENVPLGAGIDQGPGRDSKPTWKRSLSAHPCRPAAAPPRMSSSTASRPMPSASLAAWKTSNRCRSRRISPKYESHLHASHESDYGQLGDRRSKVSKRLISSCPPPWTSWLSEWLARHNIRAGGPAGRKPAMAQNCRGDPLGRPIFAR